MSEPHEHEKRGTRVHAPRWNWLLIAFGIGGVVGAFATSGATALLLNVVAGAVLLVAMVRNVRVIERHARDRPHGKGSDD